MSAPFRVAFALLLALAALPATASAQAVSDPPAVPPPAGRAGGPPVPEVDLVFDREVFAYPSFDRRNPFRALTGAETGPRFENLVLRGRILDASNPRASIALLEARAAAGGQQRAAAGGETFRVRVGDVVGNARIMEIREDRIVAEVEDFGEIEVRTLMLVRTAPRVERAPIGPPPAAPASQPGQATSGAGQGGGPDDGTLGAGGQGAAPPVPPAVGMGVELDGNPWNHSRIVNGGRT